MTLLTVLVTLAINGGFLFNATGLFTLNYETAAPPADSSLEEAANINLEEIGYILEESRLITEREKDLIFREIEGSRHVVIRIALLGSPSEAYDYWRRWESQYNFKMLSYGRTDSGFIRIGKPANTATFYSLDGYHTGWAESNWFTAVFVPGPTRFCNPGPEVRNQIIQHFNNLW